MSSRRATSWITHLRRRTTSGPWLPQVDGLRFIAIASVLLFHIQSQIDRRYAPHIAPAFAWFVRGLRFGHRGVPLFFAISGFVLSMPFARHHLLAGPVPSIRKYILRRITRLEPPYLVNLALVAFSATIGGYLPRTGLLTHLAASATYTHYLFFHAPSTINSVAWSLEVEVQFYLLAPLLAAVFALRAEVRRTLLAAAALLASLLQTPLGLSQFTLAGNLQYFLAGYLLADLYLTTASLSRHPRLWDCIGLIGWPVFFLGGERFSGLWLPPLILLLCWSALRGKFAGAAFRTTWIAVIGGMCYTIYLWHAPVLTVVDDALRRTAILAHAAYPLLFLVDASVKIAAVALVSLPLFVFLERPCMDPAWPARLLSRLRSVRQQGPSLTAERGA